MGLNQESLFSKGEVASIFEETLSDGSHVYNLRVYDSRDETNYAQVEARDEKHALKMFQVINDFQLAVKT